MSKNLPYGILALGVLNNFYKNLQDMSGLLADEGFGVDFVKSIILDYSVAQITYFNILTQLHKRILLNNSSDEWTEIVCQKIDVFFNLMKWLSTTDSPLSDVTTQQQMFAILGWAVEPQSIVYLVLQHLATSIKDKNKIQFNTPTSIGSSQLN